MSAQQGEALVTGTWRPQPLTGRKQPRLWVSATHAHGWPESMTHTTDAPRYLFAVSPPSGRARKLWLRAQRECAMAARREDSLQVRLPAGCAAIASFLRRVRRAATWEGGGERETGLEDVM
jgi:hypothetical protein